MAGYSGTPLSKKLGIKSGIKLYVANAPRDYSQWLAPLPDEVAIVSRVSSDLDLIHLFTREKSELASALPKYKDKIKQNGAIWVSWPKKASKVATDITEDVIREVALPLGLVDIKVCAVDAVWSGLKLVIRKENRR
ncbi:MAG: DUF3052 family protein [Gammaproteobacteria bacterium]|nr:DUF3052 family protein [Gammaproteobacteria bacterium]